MSGSGDGSSGDKGSERPSGDKGDKGDGEKTKRVPRPISQAPVYKLSVKLLSTYKHINEVYYKRKRARKAAEAASKKSYDYEFKAGELLGDRYRVRSVLGKGSFGMVVSAYDTHAPLEDAPEGTPEEERFQKVAVKVIKSKEAFRRQSKTELRLLELLNRLDPDDSWCVVRLTHKFVYLSHVCLVFEHLSVNLYELLRRSHFRGVPIDYVRKFGRQILKTLVYLSLPDVDVIHCDLKPENILFRKPNRSAIKVVDFGSSCRRTDQTYVYIQSRFYRSPEVILGLPYDQAIDMWSLGCILVELLTGVPLFSGRDEADQMRRLVALKGPPPRHMLARCKKARLFFDKVAPAARSAADLDAVRARVAARERAKREAAGRPVRAPPASEAPRGAPLVAVLERAVAAGERDGPSLPRRLAEQSADEAPSWSETGYWSDGCHAAEDGVPEGAWLVTAERTRAHIKASEAIPPPASATASATAAAAAAAAADRASPTALLEGGAAGGGGATDAIVARRIDLRASSPRPDGPSPADLARAAVEAARAGASAVRASSSSTPSDDGMDVGGGGSGAAAAHLPTSRPARVSADTARGFVAARRWARRKALTSRALPTVYSVKPRPKPLTPKDPKVNTDLREVLGVFRGGPRRHESTPEMVQTLVHFVDLVERMLEWDPAVRIKPMEALNHPFFREDLMAFLEGRAATAGRDFDTDDMEASGGGGRAPPSPPSSTPSCTRFPARDSQNTSENMH